MSKEGGGWVKGDSGESFYCSGTINNYGSSSTYPSGSDDQNSGSNNVVIA